MRPIRIPARRGWLLMSSLLALGLITGSVGTALVSSVTPQPTTSILANRIRVPIGTQRAFLLRLPSLGYLYVDCIDGGCGRRAKWTLRSAPSGRWRAQADAALLLRLRLLG